MNAFDWALFGYFGAQGRDEGGGKRVALLHVHGPVRTLMARATIVDTAPRATLHARVENAQTTPKK